MMSVSFHFQRTLNRLFNNCITYKVILKLYKFFLKYVGRKGGRGGGGINPPPSLEKLPSKSLDLLRIKRKHNPASEHQLF